MYYSLVIRGVAVAVATLLHFIVVFNFNNRSLGFGLLCI